MSLLFEDSLSLLKKAVVFRVSSSLLFPCLLEILDLKRVKIPKKCRPSSPFPEFLLVVPSVQLMKEALIIGLILLIGLFLLFGAEPPVLELTELALGIVVL